MLFWILRDTIGDIYYPLSLSIAYISLYNTNNRTIKIDIDLGELSCSGCFIRFRFLHKIQFPSLLKLKTQLKHLIQSIVPICVVDFSSEDAIDLGHRDSNPLERLSPSQTLTAAFCASNAG